MIEIQNATVYKCEHCNYQDTMKARLLSHENKCLSEQLKTAKNKDKQEIYNILDVDLINIKVRDFLEKYNLPTAANIEFIKITIDNSFLPGLELDTSIKSIFDRTKFRLYNELSNLRYSKEHFHISNPFKIIDIDEHILLKQKEIKALNDKKAEIILESVKVLLERK